MAWSIWEYLMLLPTSASADSFPARFALFAAVGTSGLVVHVASLAVRTPLLPFAAAQLTASVVAMITNFLINNALTYRDRRLRGTRLLTGLVTFVAVCSVGAVANVRFAIDTFEHDHSWWAVRCRWRDRWCRLELLDVVATDLAPALTSGLRLQSWHGMPNKTTPRHRGTEDDG